MDSLRVPDNEYPEGIHNTIVGIFEVVLKDEPVLFPYALAQIKLQIFIEFGTVIHYRDCIHIRIHTANLGPNK